MRTFILLLFTPLLLAACVAPGTHENGHNDCGTGPAPGPPVNVHYGDSQLKVTPVIFKIPRKTKIKFHLMPDKRPTDPGGVDYGTVKVTIKAKDSYAYPWFKASGTDEEDGDLEICVPAGATLGVMDYWVHVEKVGKLDPRADIEH